MTSNLITHLRPQTRQTYTTRDFRQDTHGKGVPRLKEAMCQWVWLNHTPLTTTVSQWVGSQNLHKYAFNFTSHSLLPQVSPNRFAICSNTLNANVQQMVQMYPGNCRTQQKHFSCLIATLSTWTGSQDNVILKLHFKSVRQFMHSSRMSGWVRSGYCKPYTVLRKSVHRKQSIQIWQPSTTCIACMFCSNSKHCQKRLPTNLYFPKNSFIFIRYISFRFVNITINRIMFLEENDKQ